MVNHSRKRNNDELYHHGILGQKWGIRRYQNPDGTYTAEGKARRNTSLSSKDIKEMKKSMISTSIGAYVPAKVGKDASILGLKALRKLGQGDVSDEDISDAEESERGDYWFLYEDQTIGCAAVASLINAGYSAEKCKELIKYAESIPYDGIYEEKNIQLWELREGNYKGALEEFADVCEKIKKEEISETAKKKLINPQPPKIVHSNDYELYHHGILGQKWGVRRYQNEDGTYTEAGKKRRAHEYTKELNLLSKNQARSLAKIAGINRWNDLDRLSYKIKKQTKKQQLGKSNQKKIDRLTKKLNKKKLRVEELKNEYTNSKQKIDKLIKSVSKNKDFVYKTSPMYIGTNGNWFTNESWYQTVWGTEYKVKTATDKRKKSIKWTERHSEYPIVPVHTTYYYY